MTTTKLFFVIGASGVGKDSLLHYARCHLDMHSPITFAHRYITRAATLDGENHIALSEDEFNHRQQHGCFAMHWRSHGIQYGVGLEIENWLRSGLHVVVNGSRAYLKHATQKYEQLIPVLITADDHVLRQRLLERGRENHEDIETRLIRAQAFNNAIQHPQLLRITNNGHLPEAGDQFINILQGSITTC